MEGVGTCVAPMGAEGPEALGDAIRSPTVTGGNEVAGELTAACMPDCSGWGIVAGVNGVDKGVGRIILVIVGGAIEVGCFFEN